MYKSLCIKNITVEELLPLKGLNLTSVFVPADNINQSKIDLIKHVLGGDTKVDLIFKCFEGKELQLMFPDAMPVDFENGQINDFDYFPVSPINDELRTYLLAEIESLCKLKFDSLWLDQIHFPTKWWVNEPNILDTDYSDYCLKKFEDVIGEPIEGLTLDDKYLHIDGSYYHEWLMFKCACISDFSRSSKKIANEAGHGLGLFFVPWEESDYRAGIKRILGQDHSVLVDISDEIALSFPYLNMQKDDLWVKSKISYFWHLGKKFISVIDLQNEDSSNLEKILPFLQESPSNGFVVIVSGHLTEKQLKFLSL